MGRGTTRALTDNDGTSPARLYRSWSSAPIIAKLTGAKFDGYERREGAFVFTRTGDGAIAFTVEASEDSPLHNPAIVIRNWPGSNAKAEIKLDGAASKDIRQGVVIDTDGTYKLVVWMELESDKPVTTTIKIR